MWNFLRFGDLIGLARIWPEKDLWDLDKAVGLDYKWPRSWDKKNEKLFQTDEPSSAKFLSFAFLLEFQECVYRVSVASVIEFDNEESVSSRWRPRFNKWPPFGWRTSDALCNAPLPTWTESNRKNSWALHFVSKIRSFQVECSLR